MILVNQYTLCHSALTILWLCTPCMIRISVWNCVDVRRPIINFLIRCLTHICGSFLVRFTKQRRECLKGARRLSCEPVRELSFVSWGVGRGSNILNYLLKQYINFNYLNNSQFSCFNDTKNKKIGCYLMYLLSYRISWLYS